MVRVAPDSTGKRIANQTVERPADGTTVYRQEVALADPELNAELARVKGGRLQTTDDLLRAVLLELQRIRVGISQLTGADLAQYDGD